MNLFNKITLLTLLTFSGAVHAIEITPFLGLRGGGDFNDTETNKEHTVEGSDSFALIVGFPYKKGSNIEIFYSHQSSELKSVNVDLASTTGSTDIPLTIDYLHIGGTTPISTDEKLKTFVSGGLGFTYLSPDLEGLQSDLRASFSLGLGLLWPIANNIDVRLETRASATLFNSNSALFCNGGCSLSVNGSLFVQAEVLAGVTFRF